MGKGRTSRRARGQATSASGADQGASEVAIEAEKHARRQAAAADLMGNSDCIEVLCKQVMRTGDLRTYAAFRLASSALLDIWQQTFVVEKPWLRIWPKNVELGLARIHSQDAERRLLLAVILKKKTERAKHDEDAERLMAERTRLEGGSSSRTTRSMTASPRQELDSLAWQIPFHQEESERCSKAIEAREQQLGKLDENEAHPSGPREWREAIRLIHAARLSAKSEEQPPVVASAASASDHGFSIDDFRLHVLIAGAGTHEWNNADIFFAGSMQLNDSTTGFQVHNIAPVWPCPLNHDDLDEYYDADGGSYRSGIFGRESGTLPAATIYVSRSDGALACLATDIKEENDGDDDWLDNLYYPIDLIAPHCDADEQEDALHPERLLRLVVHLDDIYVGPDLEGWDEEKMRVSFDRIMDYTGNLQITDDGPSPDDVYCIYPETATLTWTEEDIPEEDELVEHLMCLRWVA